MKIPKLSRSSNGYAYVNVGHKKIYLGKWGALETSVAYAEYVNTLVHGDQEVLGNNVSVVTLADLVISFFEAKKDYYVSNGRSTRQLERFKIAFQIPIKLYSSLPVDEFGPLKLQKCRQAMIETDRFGRKYLNTLVNCIRQVFKYGVEQELVKPETLLALQSVSAIKRGRTTMRDSVPVRPVDPETVDKTLEYLPPTVAAMVQLQRLTGMRPGEVCIMRASDISVDDDLWVYTLSHDKTDYRRDVGDLRTIPLGRRAQAVLEPILAWKRGDDYLFSPADAERQRGALDRLNRKTPISATTRRRDARPDSERMKYNLCYDTASYRRAIEYACRRAGVPKWSPNQLRHLYATEIRAKYGLEAAQVMLGHSNANVTQIYAERDREKALQIARLEG